MKTKEYIDFFATQIERSTRGLDVARGARNVQLAALNGRQLFKGHLITGLVRWKQGDSPVQDFERAIQCVQEVSESVLSWDSSFDTVASLPVARVALISRLLDKTPAEALTARAAESDLAADVRLDALLAADISADDAIQSAVPLINGLSADKKSALAAETYENYFQILRSSIDPKELNQRAEKGEILFLHRAKDPYYRGADQSEGGGDDNAYLVDFRLAVVLKRAKYDGQSIHAWKW